MRRFLIFLALILLWTLIMIAQDRYVKQKFSVGANHFTFTGSAETWNEVSKQIKLNNLICDILADEANGLHPYAKIRLAKKLAKELED
jgi:hypothetical protein